MPNIPLLPNIDNNQVPGGDAGKWFTTPGSFMLHNISDGLDLGTDRFEEVNSVPSPWSRALQYRSAIANERYPSGKWLLIQYRGLLATLALSEVLQLKITAQHVDLTRANSIDSSNDGRVRYNFELYDTMISTLPFNADSLYLGADGNNVWSSIFVFRLKDHIIGFTSPATLAVPSSRLHSSLENEVKWIRYGFFLDPTKYLSGYQKKSLAGWLDNLKRLLPGDGPSQDLRNGLLGLVREFRNELIANTGEVREYIDSKVDYGGIKLAPKPLTALYPIGVGDDTSQSNVRVVPGRGKSPTKVLYMYDHAKIHRVLNRSNEEITVIGALTLANFTLEKGKAISSLAQDDFISPAELFLKDLYYFQEENVFPGNWLADKLAGTGYSILLPVSSLLLDYYTGDQLKDMLSFNLSKQEGRPCLRISIRVPISGFNDTPTIFEHDKVYYFLPELELKLGALPTIALWPNVLDPRAEPTQNKAEKHETIWSRYYLFVEHKKSNEDVAFRLRITADTKSSSSFTTEFTNISHYEIEHFPEMLVACKSERDDIGLIPVCRPSSNSYSAEWIIGVDFGTSLTNVAINTSADGNVKTTVLPKLNPLLLVLTKQNETSLYSLQDHFVPSEFPEPDNPDADFSTPPIPTILSKKGSQSQDTTIDVIRKVRIYHASSASNLNYPYILTDIKWTMPEYVEPFLKHLTLLLSAHALSKGVMKVHWRISYPTAFSDIEKDGYIGTWKNTIIPWLAKLTGQSHIFKSKEDVLTESIACARYFSSKDRELQHACTVDIGGGTTDISFHSQSKPVYQVSVRYAGRDIFHRLLNPSAKISNTAFISMLLGDKGDRFDGWNADSTLDLWLRDKGSDYLSSIGYKKSVDQPIGIQFRSYLAFSIGGLYYYIGLVNKYLNDQGLLYNKKQVVSLLLGGNGSRFLKWMSPFGDFSTSTEAQALLDAILQSASGLQKSSFGSELSEQPKSEACLGLAVLPQGNHHDNRKVDNPFLGLTCSIVGSTEESISEITKEYQACDRLDVPPGFVIKSFTISDSDLEPLEAYIQAFNSSITTLSLQGFKPLTVSGKGPKRVLNKLSDDQRGRLKEYVAGALQSKLLAVNGFEKEPMFIIALKCLIRVLSEDLAIR